MYGGLRPGRHQHYRLRQWFMVVLAPTHRERMLLGSKEADLHRPARIGGFRRCPFPIR